MSKLIRYMVFLNNVYYTIVKCLAVLKIHLSACKIINIDEILNISLKKICCLYNNHEYSKNIKNKTLQMIKF